MSKSKRYHSHSHYKKHKKKRTRRHHHHNYRHEYNMTGGYDSVPLTTDNKAISPPSGEEKKTVFSVLGSVIGKGVDKALNLVGYEKSNPPPPEPPSTNPVVIGASNAAKNISNAATSALTEGLDIVQEKLNDPQTVEQLEKTIDLAAPVAEKVLDKSVDMLAKEGPKVAMAVEDIGVNFVKAIPYVGAVAALGSELNDAQAIAQSGMDAAKEVTDTLAEGIADAKEQANNAIQNVEEAGKNVVQDTLNNNINTAAAAAAIEQKGGEKTSLRNLQKAGAKINHRIKSSMKEFNTSKNKNKTQKRVRFEI